AQPLPRPPKLPGMGQNSGLEALAIRDDGLIVAVPERSANESTPFTVLAFDGAWSDYAQIRRDPRWLAVGADFGPDGWFYLLERDFRGILGFATRVRRMQLTPGVLQDDEILLETSPLQYDNLEGISVWHDGTGIRITMISDDNFLFLQRTEIVEYRLRDTDLQAQQN
ncbi:esterase-like activity of phytase family protein, partial [Paracoccus nototheniae]